MSPKSLILVAAVSSTLTLLAGCASSPAVVHKRDGSTIVTPERPKFDKNTGFYEYKDSGRVIRINKDEVMSIDDVEK